ncbi:hypothetical protein IE53DRAFT_411000 [Violaceomyces palustris]|uniref:Uncharacterized protein n=1 Tax=Violaceomyces palustris TaxID=1673888 RepID=A0ACD0NX04_9BASI|nr:hypothetical protein IE53DRAFT_411000 [Violaceomyces palustris]
MVATYDPTTSWHHLSTFISSTPLDHPHLFSPLSTLAWPPASQDPLRSFTTSDADTLQHHHLNQTPSHHGASSSSLLLAILPWSPPLLILLRILVKLFAPAWRTISPTWLQATVDYFEPLVSHQEALLNRQGGDDPTLTSAKGSLAQRKRILLLLALSLIESIGWSTSVGWAISLSTSSSLSLLHLIAGRLATLATWLSIMVLLTFRPPQTPPLFILLLLVSLLVSSLANLFQWIPLLFRGSGLGLNAHLAFNLLDPLVLSACMATILSMPITPGGYSSYVPLSEKILHSSSATIPIPESESSKETYANCPTSPEDYCSLYQSLSYSWMNAIQDLSLKRPLVATDVWKLRSINDTRLLYRKFSELDCFGLKDEAKEEGVAKPRKRSLLAKILRANSNDVALDALFKLIGVTLAYAGTYIMRSILVCIQNADAHERDALAPNPDDPVVATWTPRSEAVVYATLGLGLAILRFLAELRNFHHARQVGLRIRSTLVISLFEKTLKRRDLRGAVKEEEGEKGRKEEQEEQEEQDGDGDDADGQAEASRAKGRVKKPARGRAKRSTTATSKGDADQTGADIGKIVNMMASDINILLRMGCDLHQLYGAPVEVTIATFFLYKLMGWSSLVGFSILVAAIPVNYYWGESAVAKQREYSRARDERMSLMDELIHAISYVKIQGLSSNWKARVSEAREREIRKLIWCRFLSFLFELLWTSVPVMVTLISFFFYVKVEGKELTVDVAFTAISLFTMLRPPLNAVPGFLMGGLIALVSVKRLEGFLEEEEVDELVSSLAFGSRGAKDEDGYRDSIDLVDTGTELDPGSVLAIKKGTFTWSTKRTAAAPADLATAPGVDADSASDGSAFTLHDIDVEFPPNAVSVIIGPTGSGKSSLLSALLGEMREVHPTGGRRPTGASSSLVQTKFDSSGRSTMSYASQLPWLEAGKTLRDSVCFFTPFEPKRYREVLRACALEEDVKSMVDGDMTRISSHTVSGGQKARISLARAVYAHSKTVILDDVLSAVDTRVQGHLVREVLGGPLMRGRRCVIATHHASLLTGIAKYVVVMGDGKVVCQGSVEDVRLQGYLLAKANGWDRAHGASSGPHGASGESEAKEDDSGSQQENPESPSSGLELVVDEGPTPAGIRTPKLLYEAEKRRQGAVSWIFYKTYLRASSVPIWSILVLLLLGMRLSSSFEQFWLKVWGEAYRSPTWKQGLNEELPPSFSGESVEGETAGGGGWWDIARNLPPAKGNEAFYLTVYGITGACIIVFNSLKSIGFYVASIRASRRIYNELLVKVVGAPIRWFETTPPSRILNRFGTDTDVVDNILPQSIMNLANNSFAITAYLLICFVIVPSFILPTILIMVVAPWYVKGFLASSRDMQRIEATSTSPLYAHFQETMAGISIIRSFGGERQTLENLLDSVDLYQSLWWSVCTMEVWLSFRSQILGGFSVFAVSMLAITGKVSAGSAGLGISSAQLICQMGYYLVNDIKNLSNSFNSLERVAEYQDVVQEGENDRDEEEEEEEEEEGEETEGVGQARKREGPIQPPPDWPSKNASIRFENVWLRYSKDLPMVLKGLSFEIRAGEKVGIIGRTGSGKSSLVSSLLRTTSEGLKKGRILIDGIDISRLDLETLRSKISIVMQDPVLFSGSLRENLDPFGQFEDEEILNVMRRVGIAAAAPLGRRVETVERGQEGTTTTSEEEDPKSKTQTLNLNTRISSGGTNLSAGQSQLVSLTRSLLKDSNILILDEATSSTDMETDSIIQNVLRKDKSSRTLICVAHRISSILYYDRILVLDKGEVVEFDSPANLLRKEDDDPTAIFKQLFQLSSDRDQLENLVRT